LKGLTDVKAFLREVALAPATSLHAPGKDKRKLMSID